MSMSMSTSVVSTSPSFNLLQDVAANMVEAAVAVTAGKMHLESPRAAAGRLHRDHPVAVAYFRHELARQIASLLLQMSQVVEAVYEEQDVPESEELAPAALSLSQPIRLYVHVSLSTAGVHSLIEGLSAALGSAIAAHLRCSVSTVIDPVVVGQEQIRLLRPRAFGYRPAPLLLAARDDARDAD
jgi:hypothetical protein